MTKGKPVAVVLTGAEGKDLRAGPGGIITAEKVRTYASRKKID